MQISKISPQAECFVTRVWGFTPETWGAIGFPKPGTADRWLKSEENLHVVCFVSHNKADHIDEIDQGKVLGVYELSREVVRLETDEVLADHHLSDPVMRHDDGRFRWPVGLRARRAWRFQPKVPLTRQALPDARTWSYDVSTDLVSITERDYKLLDQSGYHLVEVPVYGIEFSKQRLADPNAVPSFVYMFACAKNDILQRLLDWSEGDILIKVGCASDVGQRLDKLNNDPISRIFGLKLSKVGERWVGEKDARLIESDLLAEARILGRPACSVSTEYFFVRETAYKELLMKFADILRVN